MKTSADKTEKIFSKSFTLITLINLFICLSWQSLMTGLPLLATSRGADDVYVGLLTTVAAIAALIVRPISGAFVDNIGRKPVLMVSVISLIVLTFGSLMFPTGAAGIVIRILQGFAWGFASTANSTLPLDVISPKCFAESMAFFGVFSSAAMALAPTITSQLSEDGDTSWIIYTTMAFLALTLIVSIVLFGKNYKEPIEDKHISLKEAFRIDRLIFPKSIFPAILICLVSMAAGNMQTFFNLACGERGLSATYIYYIAFALTTLAIRPVIGRLADKKGYYLFGILACVISAISMVLVAFTENDMMLFISGIVVGLGTGGAATVFQAMAVALSDKSTKGAATSTYMLFMNLGVSIGGLLGGGLTSSIGYTGMFLVMGGVQLLAGIIFVAGGKKRIAQYSNICPETKVS